MVHSKKAGDATRRPSPIHRPKHMITLLVVAGAIAGSVALWHISAPESQKSLGEYTVHKIAAVEKREGNWLAQVIVYRDGEDGHTKLLSCLFPPDQEFEEVVERQPSQDGSSSPFDKFGVITGYSGVERLRVVGAYESSRKEIFYCEAV